MPFLWLTRFLPYPPLQGGDIEYSRELMHSLARQGRVHVLAYQSPGVSPPDSENIHWETLPYSRPSPLFGLPSSLPDVAFRFRTDHYLERAVALAANAEGVLVDFLAMAWVVKPLKEALIRAGIDTPVVMITHNHESALRKEAARSFAFPKNLVIGFDARKAAKLEQASNAKADGITAIIQEDAAAFAHQCDTPSLVLLPGYLGPKTQNRRITSQTPRVASIIGNRTAAHKVAVLKHALEAIHRAGADKRVAITIAGAADLGSLTQRYADFSFLGFVEDLPSHLASVRLGLIPDDLGGGFKMRVLALAMARVPILGLNSAMVGTTFKPGVHYYGVDTLDEMAQVLPTLIDDIDTLDQIQERAYAHSVQQFDWNDRGARLAQFVANLRRRDSLVSMAS